jgi:iron complex outermembrane receptor protein
LLLTKVIFDITKSDLLVPEYYEDDSYQASQVAEQRHKVFEIATQGAVTDKLFIMASVINLATVYKNDEEYTGKTPIDAPE